MQKTIVVVGATGNLGGQIINNLLAKGVLVKALVRAETDAARVEALQYKGVEVCRVDMHLVTEMAKHCVGAACVVSALAGLRETIIGVQKNVLDAAVAAKVPRFIPSDYSIDFTNLRVGNNRNLDLRREFHGYLSSAPIRATTVFNGAFMELLTTDMPLILFKQRRILCWGNPHQPLEFTTIPNVAQFTAEAALDDDAPRFLRIAGDRLSCHEFVNLLTKITGQNFKLFRPGGIGLLNGVISLTKFLAPAPRVLYPAWQGMQYMRDLMEGRIVFQPYDNQRYPAINWTSTSEFLTREGIGTK